jgi:hypothetical protein
MQQQQHQFAGQAVPAINPGVSQQMGVNSEVSGSKVRSLSNKYPRGDKFEGPEYGRKHNNYQADRYNQFH